MSDELAKTELPHPDGIALDTLDAIDIVRLIAQGGHEAADAVAAEADSLARVVDESAHRLARGGRLHYVGAGTSGRLGVLDSSEMGPTFGTPPELVCAHVAGGDAALRFSAEGAEDDGDAGLREMREHIDVNDVVIAISASGNGAFAVGALAQARRIGAYTVAIVNSEPAALAAYADCVVVLRTGAEVLRGSTRLKAGTAQKLALNALSTAVMVRLGHVYNDLMIDVVASNRKLHARALRMIEGVADVDAARAEELLRSAQGNAKSAIVMALRCVDAVEASALLEKHHGRLRDTLQRGDA